MLQRLITRILCLVFVGLAAQISAFADTTLRVEPQKIQANDTFQVILISDNVQNGGLPNLTPLQNDFTILGTQRSISYSMINGQTTSRSQWVILLRPKKAGKIIIPPLKVGQEETAPSFIEVSDEGASIVSDDIAEVSADVMLKTNLSDNQPYVNQQVIYTVKLYSNTQLVNAEYHPPIVENALLIPLGDGRHYQTQIKGQSYGVEEQQYAIFPQKSGNLSVKAPSFHATVYDTFPKPITDVPINSF